MKMRNKELTNVKNTLEEILSKLATPIPMVKHYKYLGAWVDPHL